jgi:hypothetical protein
MKLRDLPNIGAVLESKLLAAGIATVDELKELGSKASFVRLLADDESC